MIHVYPTIGLRHRTDLNCWCEPKVEIVLGVEVCIHGAIAISSESKEV